MLGDLAVLLIYHTGVNDLPAEPFDRLCRLLFQRSRHCPFVETIRKHLQSIVAQQKLQVPIRSRMFLDEGPPPSSHDEYRTEASSSGTASSGGRSVRTGSLAELLNPSDV